MSNHNSKITIPVVVVKPFDAIRTPCPPAGTMGELYDFSDEYACVRFPLPMIDQDGTKWLTDHGDTEFMYLKFKLDEIE